MFEGQPIYFKNWVNNIKYVKDLFKENRFKTIEEVSREICTTRKKKLYSQSTFVLQMYFVNTISLWIQFFFRCTREVIDGQESTFINIKINKRYFNFHGKYCTIYNQTCKLFNEIFVKK